MKIGRFFVGTLNDAQLAAIKDAGHSIVTDAKAAATAVEGAIVNSPVGSTIEKMIHDVETTGKSGAEKFADVLKDASPLVASFATDHGVSLIASAENTARGVIQTIFNATIGAIAKAAGVANAPAAQ